jgi:NAD(P)-dependent dehydrogenase (short-subunit alcohol dehydrogenase family)
MGRAVARLCAARGDRVCLLGRDRDELERSVRDLAARGASAAESAHCDLADAATFEPALDEAARLIGVPDLVIVTAAAFATQPQLEADRAQLQRLLTTNFTNTILFCEAARERLLAGGTAGASPSHPGAASAGVRSAAPTLCVFSSVAGERGRKPVILYGATKAGLSAYLEGLDHKFHARGLRVVCVKPGFVRTSMTEGLPEPPFAADPDAVARRVLAAIDRGTPVVYAPPIWALIMAVIRLLPRAIMRRLDF